MPGLGRRTALYDFDFGYRGFRSNLGAFFFHSDVGVRRRGIETWVTAMSNLGTNFFHSDVGFRRRGIETWVIAMSNLGTNFFTGM